MICPTRAPPATASAHPATSTATMLAAPADIGSSGTRP